VPVHYLLQGAAAAAYESSTVAQAYPSTWHCPLLKRPSHACKQYGYIQSDADTVIIKSCKIKIIEMYKML
jgi:hypothetical protein